MLPKLFYLSSGQYSYPGQYSAVDQVYILLPWQRNPYLTSPEVLPVSTKGKVVYRAHCYIRDNVSTHRYIPLGG